MNYVARVVVIIFGSFETIKGLALDRIDTILFGVTMLIVWMLLKYIEKLEEDIIDRDCLITNYFLKIQDQDEEIKKMKGMK